MTYILIFICVVDINIVYCWSITVPAHLQPQVREALSEQPSVGAAAAHLRSGRLRLPQHAASEAQPVHRHQRREW